MKSEKDWMYCEIEGQPTIILTKSFGEISHCVAVAIDNGAALDVQELRDKTPVENCIDNDPQ